METHDQQPIAHDLISSVDFLLEGMSIEVVSGCINRHCVLRRHARKVQMVTYTEPE